MAAIAEDPNGSTCRHPDLAYEEEVLMIQQGQVFRLASVARDGSELWAYRYRTGGRQSRRIQRGGYASEQDAGTALGANAREAATGNR
jgi:hypothetical protein